MASTGARTLHLLSLLQRRRYWPGPALAAALEVSERTLRRDVDRLRDLGYDVTSARGVEGGYRFEPGAAIPPLQFDDDEAVALTVALHTSSAAHDIGLADAVAGALGKLIAVLPPASRDRAEALRAVTDVGSFVARGESPPVAVLGRVAQACRDHVRLSFTYGDRAGETTERYVEPYRLVPYGWRWYLVAFDSDRDDWRTFRVDRLRDPRPTRTPFTPRPTPAGDLHTYVRERIRDLRHVHHVVIDVDAPAAHARAAVGRWVRVVERDIDRCRVEMETESLDWPVLVLAALDAPFTIVEPAELAERVRGLARRFSEAGRVV